MRRCGWAFIQQEVGGALIASVSGVLGGPVQTVARAELVAYVEALRSTACNGTVISDSAYVANEFAKVQLGIFSSKHRDLWAIVRRCIRSRLDRRMRCVKVKHHTTEEDLAVGRYGITRYTRDGITLQLPMLARLLSELLSHISSSAR